MRSRLVTLLVALAITLAATAPAVAAGSEIGASGIFSIGPGHTFIADVPGATSTLVRTANGISVSVQTSGLLEGHAVTVWALIFNNPNACLAGCQEMAGDLDVPAVQGSVFHVTGHVVTAGETSFGGRVNVGDIAHTFRGQGCSIRTARGSTSSSATMASRGRASSCSSSSTTSPRSLQCDLLRRTESRCTSRTSSPTRSPDDRSGVRRVRRCPTGARRSHVM